MDQRPIIYLLPGLLCDQDVWQHQSADLSQHAEVRIPDFKGLDSLEKMADLVLDEAPEQFSVIGHSMGGRVGFELINRAPERIRHLMLLNVGAHPVNEEESEQRLSLVDAAESIGMDRYAKQWASLLMKSREHENVDVRTRIESMVRRQSINDFRGHIKAGLGRKDQSTYLRQIKRPVLLIVGELDTWSTVNQHVEIKQSLSSAKLEVIPEAGHMALLDQPELVSTLLVEWFLKH
jgi:pimeloyl-ACP methyl ester carboxylesterase